ncbi:MULTISPECIES: hypothetical protein [Chlamydia]|uniref:Uncharacterized protein n=2 Tax=Chlamydia TaxID=810 RepID=A0ABP2X798_CHLPS|nr:MULTISPECIES: hypothetical protein [Chlamydia]AFS19825.1 hypothetical protein B595_0870 [Chlamydia psittaci 84/55]AFS23014.1 hypothetical protein B600_0868 [Chlamydia psittaci VS225]EPJ16371.1 hypothetical protein CP02DC18_0152 [Chlamydia psittaci 02DC18]EPJ17673.1 hypothetical protein CP02DC22_0142 [Chlamydia psittaci 02DC22]EPJ20285.1 hypothetical protein CP02DC23_0496 [Chlamydia psittaci 02DC23]EPJ20416.1 hypothetical protein CP03DC29_0945 [Chlamydia psittaci 03DC29]EPJ21485.1 hypothet
MKNKIHELLNQLYENQKSRLQNMGEQIIPNLTSDDVLQPMDFSLLEENPFFRFEEGVLSGLGEARAAILALFADEA